MNFFSDENRNNYNFNKNNYIFDKNTPKKRYRCVCKCNLLSRIKNLCSKCNLNCCSKCSCPKCPTCSNIHSFAKSRPYCFALIISGLTLFIIILIIIIAVFSKKNKSNEEEEKSQQNQQSKEYMNVYNTIGDNDKGTLTQFCSFLSKEASHLSEDGKVNLAYKWITTNIRYDEDIKNAIREPDEFFKSRKTVCTGYAHLLYRLLISMNYNPDNIRNISGYSKGGSYDVLKEPEENHMWSSVKINGKWCLFDATWDEGVSDYAYYCPKPECFVRDHLPTQSEYQYLSNPIDKKTFSNYVWTTGYFCQFNAKITEDKSFYNSCGDGQGSFTVNYNVDYETKLDISIDKNDKAKVDFKITSINKGYTVNYNYYNITKNEQVKLYLLMLDENLQTRHIGTIFLICNSDS